MEQRHRTRNFTRIFGSAWYQGVAESTPVVVDRSEEMTDFFKKEVRISDDVLFGTLPPSDLDHTVITRNPPLLFRPQFNHFAWYFDGLPRQTLADPGFGTPLLLPARGNPARTAQNEQLMLELLAKTNPLRPDFSVPVFIKELVDVGAMFHLAAKTFAGYIGSSYLNYRFGWVQFVRDLKVLAELTTSVERRMRELQSLSKHGGLRRRIDLFADSNTKFTQQVVAASSFGVTSYMTKRSQYSIRIWGSVRWACTKDFEDEIKAMGAFNVALKQVLDLEALDPETLWNLVPFSWLVDYFVDIGTYLGANEGGVMLKPHDICIMRDFKAVDSYQPWKYSGTNPPTHTAGKYTRRYKGRDLVFNASTFPTVTTGLLSWSQWKVVLALVAAFKR